MKSFDHDKPTTKAEWVFAFVAAYRKLRPEIGERYAKTNAISAYSEFGKLQPRQAAHEWARKSS